MNVFQENEETKKNLERSGSRIQLWKKILEPKKIKIAAELGVWKGDFSKQMLLSLPSIEKYYLVDPWEQLENWNKPLNNGDTSFDLVYEEAKRKINFASDRVVFLRGTTKEIIDSIPNNSLDFAYIDGDHTLRGITIDLINILHKIKEGGLIGGDDFTTSPWQHGLNYEPTLVCPFSIYFAEAVDLPIAALPYNQFIIEKRTGSQYKFWDHTGRYADLSLSKGFKKFLTEGEVDIIRDAALYIDRKNVPLAYDLISIAAKLRPSGPLIKKQMLALGSLQKKTEQKKPGNLALETEICLEQNQRKHLFSDVNDRRKDNDIMQLSEKHKAIFIHIPKCGGTSVDNSNLFDSRKGGHWPYERFVDLLGAEISSYRAFVLVRNPWDRLASAFYYLNEGGANKFDVKDKEKYLAAFDGKFDIFLEHFCDTPERYLKLTHFKEMTSFIDPQMVEIPLFIQKLEDIGNLGDLNSFLGLSLKMKHLRKRKQYANAKIYNEFYFNKIAEIYSKDLINFGYVNYTLDMISN